jgi:uncharacterized protein YbbC (DUF1343 family)
MHRIWRGVSIIAMTVVIACVSGAAARGGTGSPRSTGVKVRPGITVLLEDSIHLIAGKRIGLLTNQTGIDERGTSGIDLLHRLSRGGGDGEASPRLVALFSPEHGIRGTEDRTNLAHHRDERTGLPVYSLYGATTLPPPDSVLRRLDVLLVDLQDLGARPWTYVASMVYAVRAAAQARIPVVVLDRPNPITGAYTEGPVLDSTVAYAGSHARARAATPASLYPIPMRHGLTMGELALFYNDVLQLKADLHVIPMTGWRRTMWFDQTGLPWVKPSPNMPSLTSATLYPGVVWFESSNVSVGRGTGEPFQRIGAPWLDAERAVALLNDRMLAGVHFEAERFTPRNPGDRKYGGRTIPGIRIIITDRDRVQTSRVGAALLWAVAQTSRDSLRFRVQSFNQLFGVPAARQALLDGADPDSIIDAGLPATVAFQQRARRYLLYR